MKKWSVQRLLVLALIFLATAGALQAQQTTTVRGKVDRQTPQGVSPAIYVPVTLNSARLGRSTPAYTDQQGFYALYHVPVGEDYNVEIWTTPQQPYIHQIRVLSVPYHEVPPVLVR